MKNTAPSGKDPRGYFGDLVLVELKDRVLLDEEEMVDIDCSDFSCLAWGELPANDVLIFLGLFWSLIGLDFDFQFTEFLAALVVLWSFNSKATADTLTY